MLTREKERTMKVKAEITSSTSYELPNGKKGFRFYLRFDTETNGFPRTLDIELPDPPKPEVKTPGQIVYESLPGEHVSWAGCSTYWRNLYHAMAHTLGIGGSVLYIEPEPKPEPKPEPVTPGEAAHAAFRRNYPGACAPWASTSSNERLAWECAAQDAITVGRGDRGTR